MPSQRTDQLLNLVKSLTKAEKRHFRLFVKRNQASDDSLFLQLFDYLDKHKSYDEEQILKKIPNIKKRQLSNLKAHLYKQLLISLKLLHTQHAPEMQIREMIDYAKVLYDKGLYRQSLDLLDKAKERAILERFHPLRLAILEFEKHIESQFITNSAEGRADELTRETRQTLQLIEGVNQFSSLSLQLYSLYLKVGYVRNRKDYLFVKEFFQANLPRTPYDRLDFMGRLHYCQSHVWYYFITQEFRLCYRHAYHWVNLFQTEPEMIAIHGPLYLKGLHNLLNALFNMWYYDRFVQVLEVLEAFPEAYPGPRSRNIEGLFVLYRYLHRIKKHFMEGTFSEGLKLVPELDRLLEDNAFNWDDHRLLVFYYRIACLYFGSGDFSTAIDYLNRIIQRKNPNYRADIQCFARILNLIAHFELGNAQLVEYQAKSVYRFLSKMEDLGEVQQEIFRFLRKTLRMHSGELQGAFVRLKEKLETIEDNPFERRPFLYLDIISWLESKMENKTVQEVVQAKFANRQKRLSPEIL